MARRGSRPGAGVRHGRARIAIGVVLAVLLLVSWLSFDWLLATPRATQVVAQPPGTDGRPDRGGGTRGDSIAVGSSSVTDGASVPTRGAGVASGGDGAGPSDAPTSYLSSAGDQPGTGAPGGLAGSSVESSEHTGTGIAFGWPGSGSGLSGSATTLATSPPPYLATSPPPFTRATPDGRGPSDAPGAGLVSNAETVSGVSGGDDPAPPWGPAPPTVPTGGSTPLDSGQSRPPGGTTGPVTSATSPESGPSGWADNPDYTVPVPPALLLFGAAALMLGVVSRMRRSSPRSRWEPPLTR